MLASTSSILAATLPRGLLLPPPIAPGAGLTPPRRGPAPHQSLGRSRHRDIGSDLLDRTGGVHGDSGDFVGLDWYRK